MHSKQQGLSGINEGVAVEPPSRSDGVTAGIEGVSALTDDELLAGTRRLVCVSNRVLAALLAHLAEVEARGLHRQRACSSLYTYCIYELRMPEDTAYRRVAAARFVKRFPLLLSAIERGELHLTGVLLLGPHLTEANVAGVLERAKFRTKKEILKLVRLLSPLPDVPSRIEPLGLARPAHPFSRPTWSNFVASLCPVRELQPDERPSNWLPASESNEVEALGFGTDGPRFAPLSVHPYSFPAPVSDERAAVQPAPEHGSAPQRYKVQFTASEEYVALVEEAKALLAHALPRADLAEIHLRALRTLVAALKKRKYATLTPGSKAVAPGTGSSTSPLDHSTPADAPLARQVRSTSRHNDFRFVTPSEPATDTAPASPDAPVNQHLAPHPEQRSSRSARHSDEPAASPRQRGRYVPAAVRRAVFERDENRCTYVDARGQRCRETSKLELHHHEPFARGGPATSENLSLHCAAHNALAAEHDFGPALAIATREHPHLTERTLMREEFAD